MNHRNIWVSFVGLLIIILCFSCGQQKTEWKGTIEDVDGVTVVKNPKEPMYGPEILSIEEELSIGVVEGPEHLTFSNISDIDVDSEGNIYVLDYTESCCRVFNSEGVFLRTVGRAGQGPGELQRPLRQHLCQEYQLWIEDTRNRRFAVFTTEGEFIRNFSFKQDRISQTAADSDGNILGQQMGMSETKIPKHIVKKFNSNQEYEFTLESVPLAANPITKTYRQIFPLQQYDFTPDGGIIYGYGDAYELKLYDSHGNLKKKILKLYDPVEVPAETKEELQKQTFRDYKNIVSDNWPAFSIIHLDDKGWFYVLTYERVEDLSCYDVFDLDGKYYARIHLDFSPLVIRDNLMYAMQENEDGYLFVKRYKVTWND